jgi:hypothetical protein
LKINKHCYLSHLVGLDFITLLTLKMHGQTQIIFIILSSSPCTVIPTPSNSDASSLYDVLQKCVWYIVLCCDNQVLYLKCLVSDSCNNINQHGQGTYCAAELNACLFWFHRPVHVHRNRDGTKPVCSDSTPRVSLISGEGLDVIYMCSVHRMVCCLCDAGTQPIFDVRSEHRENRAR